MFFPYNPTYVRNIETGLISMMSRVTRGVTPIAVSPAYDKAPNKPAAPVPDDHVDTTFLESHKQFISCAVYIHL